MTPEWESLAAAGIELVGGVDDVQNEGTNRSGYKTIKTVDSSGDPTSTDATFLSSDIIVLSYRQLSGTKLAFSQTVVFSDIEQANSSTWLAPFNYQGERIQVSRKAGSDSNKLEVSFGTTAYNADNEFRVYKLKSGLEVAGTITGVTAGDGLSGGGVSGAVTVEVNTGNGTEINNDKIVVKLDGTSITRSNSGIRVTNPFTDADEAKLDGIAAGAEVNVQSDWNATSGDALILNKPTIPDTFDRVLDEDTGDLEITGNVTVQDTDAIPMPSINFPGGLVSEDITNFGTVYKSGSLSNLTFVAEFNATQGVAWRCRYSDTKPTASSDAKNYGTQIVQFESNTETTISINNVPANRYYWFSLSGGDSRIVSKREIRATMYSEPVIEVKAGTGLSGGGHGGVATLSVANPFTDADETKLDGIAAGAEVNVQSDWNASSGDAQILNKPTIPSNFNQLSGTIDSNDIGSNAVTSVKLAANAVTASKINNGVITPAKLDDGNDTKRLAFRDAIGMPVIENDGTISGALTFNANDGDVFYATLSGNVSSVTVNNLEPGQIIQVWLKQDTTGSRTLTLGSGISTTYVDAPTLSTTASATDILYFQRDYSATTVYLMGVQLGS